MFLCKRSSKRGKEQRDQDQEIMYDTSTPHCYDCCDRSEFPSTAAQHNKPVHICELYATAAAVVRSPPPSGHAILGIWYLTPDSIYPSMEHRRPILDQTETHVVESSFLRETPPIPCKRLMYPGNPDRRTVSTSV